MNGVGAATVPKEQASALLRLALLLPFARVLVGTIRCQGVRFVFFKKLALESYTSFVEPVPEPWSGIRIIFWKTNADIPMPRGWKKWRTPSIGNTYAVGRVHEAFLQDWAGNARRFVTNRQAATTWKRVSLEEFAKAYHTSGYLDPFLRHGFVRVIKDHLKVHADEVAILFFYTREQKLAGGAVFVDYPDVKYSHYLISFLTPEGRKVKAGYAFIYWWYQHMLKNNLNLADFGIVWAPGDPASWIGYSQFKKRFHPDIHTRVTYWKRA